MSALDDIDKARREAAAREIAQQIDPHAGGFFDRGAKWDGHGARLEQQPRRRAA